MKDRYSFHCKVWRIIVALIRPFIKLRFNAENTPLNVDGPCLIISNHVSDWDPFLVALSFPEKHFYFVASEHIFRLGFISRLIEHFVAPIPRRKASSGTDTVMACLRHLKAGHSVCLFAEGDACWDGVTHEVFPATGKLARNSGASLITYRLEGAYLTRPRWSKRVFKGKVFCHPVNVYTPEQLRRMTPSAITDAINSDIYENAWERQLENRTEYSNRGFADNIEQALFICPQCRKIDTLRGKDRTIRCTECGFETGFDRYCFLTPDKPFRTLKEWNDWQFDNLRVPSDSEDEIIISDDNVHLSEIFADHTQVFLCGGKMTVIAGRLCIEDKVFPLNGISMMAMVQKKKLLFSFDGRYYEIETEQTGCLRKYLAVWNKQK